MQSKETGDVVGLIHRVRKKYYHYKVPSLLDCHYVHTLFNQVSMAEFEDMQRKDAAAKREAEDPILNGEDMSRKEPSRSAMPAIKKQKSKGPAKIAALTEPQKIRDEIKILCKTLHNIPAVRGERESGHMGVLPRISLIAS